MLVSKYTLLLKITKYIYEAQLLKQFEWVRYISIEIYSGESISDFKHSLKFNFH